jgi:hypothetical protein
MSGEAYDDMTELDEFADADEDVEDYGPSEVDEMLDGLVESAEDFAERKKRNKGRRGGGRGNKPVPTAPGRNPYRSPNDSGYVTQKQLKEALTRVGVDIKRNATGIKTINTRLGTITTRVDDVVGVAKIQSNRIGRLDKRTKNDAVLELVGSIGTTGQLSLFQAYKSAVGGGLIGEGDGAFGNPLVIGGIGLLLANPNILGNVFGGTGLSNG